MTPYIATLRQKQKVCVVFVCLGNICRSPLAEGIANATYHGDRISFCSAGTSGFHNGDPIDSRSITIARKHNIDISHYTSKQVSPYAHSEADLFVAMDRQNLHALHTLGFDKQKIVLLGDFGLDGAEVPDPYYGGEKGFENVYTMFTQAISDLIAQLDS